MYIFQAIFPGRVEPPLVPELEPRCRFRASGGGEMPEESLREAGGGGIDAGGHQVGNVYAIFIYDICLRELRPFFKRQHERLMTCIT